MYLNIKNINFKNIKVKNMNVKNCYKNIYSNKI